MASITDQMTEIYVFVDEYMKTHQSIANWRSSNNQRPEFTDAEVITIALLQGCLGVDTLKKAHRLVAENYRSAFPKLCSYKQWLARLHQLGDLLGGLLSSTCIASSQDELYILDSKPIPMCKAIRHGRVRLLREDGAYWGKNSYGWFFGFKLHLLVHIEGQIMAALLTPANWHDREAAPALSFSVNGGVALADLGYRGKPLAEQLACDSDLLLISRLQSKFHASLLSSIRERIETSISILWRRFIDRVFSRSWRGLWNSIKLKLIHYNLCHAGLLSP